MAKGHTLESHRPVLLWDLGLGSPPKMGVTTSIPGPPRAQDSEYQAQGQAPAKCSVSVVGSAVCLHQEDRATADSPGAAPSMCLGKQVGRRPPAALRGEQQGLGGCELRLSTDAPRAVSSSDIKDNRAARQLLKAVA